MASLNLNTVPHAAPVPSGTRAKTSFNIGTRKSALALVQTELVVEALKKAWPDLEFQIHARDTAAGDIDKVTPFKDMPVKNLWTHELEQLLMENKLDLLVHSLKGKPLTWSSPSRSALVPIRLCALNMGRCTNSNSTIMCYWRHHGPCRPSGCSCAQSWTTSL